MKSIRNKALITILLIAVSTCSNLKRTEAETSLEAMLKSYSTSETTAEGGNWKIGFECPKILLAPSGQEYKDQGPAHIQGEKFLDNTITENQNGLVLTFKAPFGIGSLMPSVSKQISGNKHYIPWRNVDPVFTFIDPFLDSKYIQGKVVTDAGQSYNFRIVLPFKYIGSYITDEEGNKIRKRINEKAEQIRDIIRVNKEHIYILYPQYRIQKENVLKIMAGAAKIDAEVKSIQSKITKQMAENDAKKKSRDKLAQDAQKQNIAVQAIKEKIDKVKEEIHQGNASIKALSNSIVSLKESKKNPQAEIAKADKISKDTFQGVLKRFADLDTNAVDMRAIIVKAQKGFRLMQEKEFQADLAKIFP